MGAGRGAEIPPPPCAAARQLAVKALAEWMRGGRRALLSVEVDGTPAGAAGQVEEIRQLVRALPRSLLGPMDTAGRFTVRLPALRHWLDTVGGRHTVRRCDTQ